MDKIQGVNLGGWLVLERWITPSLFKGIPAWDEYGLCKELGEQKQRVLNQHYESWITETDFAWIAEQGLNTVRIPVGYWLFGDVEPFVGNVEYVDKAFDWAGKHNLEVIIDLHGAPGSQNGNDHSGRKGQIAWPNADNIAQTLDILEQLAKRYAKQSNLLAIELLNEPSNKISKKTLIDFYQQGFERVRKHTQAAVIISDAWQPNNWDKVLTEGDVWLDLHMYQVFGREDQRLGMQQHLKKALDWKEMLASIKGHPLFIGEWSLALPPKAFRGLGDFDRDKAMQAYARAQLKSFKQTKGWCYWTYKTEDSGAWNLRDCVSRGWLPSNFATDLVE